MKLAANIVYRDLDASPALNDTINKKIAKITRLSERISIPRVVISSPHHHHHKGSEFEVSLEMSLAGKIVNLSHADDNLRLAVRSLFAAAERAAKECAAKNRSKRHADKPVESIQDTPVTEEQDWQLDSTG